MTETPGDDHALAGELADAAGRLLLEVRDEVGFADARVLKDTGDLRAHEYLMAALAERCPDDSILSEEGRASVAGKRAQGAAADRAPTGNTADAVRLSAGRVWIVDPLDGTREFSEEGRRDWAVHVALWEKGRLTMRRRGAPRPGPDAPHRRPRRRAGRQERSGQARRQLRVGTARARARDRQAAHRRQPHPPARVRPAARGPARSRRRAGPDRLGRRQDLRGAARRGRRLRARGRPVRMGLGRARRGGPRPCGAHASRVDGDPLVYNREDPRLPDILVCHPVSASMLLSGIRDVRDALPK